MGEIYYYDDETADWSIPYEDDDRKHYLNLNIREISYKEVSVYA